MFIYPAVIMLQIEKCKTPRTIFFFVNIVIIGIQFCFGEQFDNSEIVLTPTTYFGNTINMFNESLKFETTL